MPAQKHFRERRSELAALPLDERFGRIYETNLWGSPDSRSGLGSGTEATAGLRASLPGLLAATGARTLLDVPCGDFSWLSTLPLDLDYIGVDIVDLLVTRNEATYGGPDTRRRFLRRDLTSDPLPRADLVLCRDCLVHLSFANVFAAFANLRRSGSTWLLTTTFLEHEVNGDIEDGDWRMLNLQHPPFNLPSPADVLVEGCIEGDGAYADKALGLWRIDDLPASVDAGLHDARVTIERPDTGARTAPHAGRAGIGRVT